jgi:pimeloyl-ACP methyl ester carboxylesterase
MDRLVGDLVLPPWQGPHPVVVFVHDQGPGVRGEGTWQQRLAAAGIASFLYDRPGCGESTGDWTMQTMPDRTGETVAAIDLIRGHDDVSANDLALIGSGQGSLVSTLAAGQSYAVAALVMISAVALGGLEVEQHRLAQRMIGAGFGSAEIALAQTLLRERVRRLTGGEGPDSVLAAEAAVHHAGWYRLMPGSTSGEIAYVARYAAIDPRPALTGLHCPLLALYGTRDATLPVERNARMLTSVLDSAGHEDHNVITVPNADHALRLPGAGDPAPGVVELIVTWLDRRLGRVDSPSVLANS